MATPAIAVLYARKDSIYKKLPGCDVWDEVRDARKWPGGTPVIAHPPCRAWGRLRHFARPAPHEKDLALHAVAMVRQWGGVLEHPKGSTLWKAAALPHGTARDEYGGWTLSLHQHWFGHRAEKATFLYVVGCAPCDAPPLPPPRGKPECVIRLDKRRADGTHIRKGDPDWKPQLSAAEREATPPAFASWLCELARRTKLNLR